VIRAGVEGQLQLTGDPHHSGCNARDRAGDVLYRPRRELQGAGGPRVHRSDAIQDENRKAYSLPLYAALGSGGLSTAINSTSALRFRPKKDDRCRIPPCSPPDAARMPSDENYLSVLKKGRDSDYLRGARSHLDLPLRKSAP